MAERKSDSQELEWPADQSCYDLQMQVGKGAFATVWRALCLSNNQTVAIKIMELENVSCSFDDIRQEVHTMRLADNPNVLHCYCSFVCGDQLWLVMQYMDKGSCLHAMRSSDVSGVGAMSEEVICYILHQTILGLEYCHSQGQLHRDIKAGNILLTADGEVRLADFGVSGWMIKYGERQDTVKTFVGTPCWMAPEVMEQQVGYNEKADIWSLGITALELAKGYAPYAHYPPMKVLLKTLQDDPPNLRSYEDDKQPNGDPFSRSFKDFVRLCLQKDPERRPACRTLLASKFFKSVKGKASSLEQYLVNVRDVSDGFEETERLKGTQPGFAHRSSESKGEGKVPSENVAPGTTWVFSDGSSTVLKSTHDEEDLNEFAKGFQAETTGENHKEMS